MKDNDPNREAAYNGYDVMTYQRFRRSLIGEARFHLHDELRAFVDSLIRHARDSGSRALSTDQDFFRARRLDAEQVAAKTTFPLSKMGAPPSRRASAGRVNAAGIPYLYLAECRETAVAEVRPWLKAGVAVARFKLAKEARVVDFCQEPQRSPRNGLAPEILDSWVELIGRSFAWPLRPDDELSYVPSQFLSESFKLAGFDGIRYPSAMRKEGVNVVLFDSESAKAESSEVLGISEVAYETQVLDGYKPA
jgi:RES domain-containing protein